MSAREHLMICREDEYGVPDLTTGAPSSGASFYVRLDEGNAFTARAVPNTTMIPFGGGYNVPHLKVRHGYSATGSFRTILHYTQAAILLGAAITRVNSGRTAPWTTTDSGSVMPEGDLASLSFYHAIANYAGTFTRKAYRGGKFTRWSLSATTDNQFVIFQGDLVFKGVDPDDNLGGSDSSAPDATEFPYPVDSDYPTDPVLFIHTGLTIASARTRFSGITIEGQNILDARRHASKTLTLARFLGRTVNLSAPIDFTATTDRTAFEALTAQDTTVEWDDGTTTITLDMHGSGRFQAIEDDLALEQVYTQTCTVLGQYDNTDNTDLTLTVAAS